MNWPDSPELARCGAPIANSFWYIPLYTASNGGSWLLHESRLNYGLYTYLRKKLIRDWSVFVQGWLTGVFFLVDIYITSMLFLVLPQLPWCSWDGVSSNPTSATCPPWHFISRCGSSEPLTPSFRWRDFIPALLSHVWLCRYQEPWGLGCPVITLFVYLFHTKPNQPQARHQAAFKEMYSKKLHWNHLFIDAQTFSPNKEKIQPFKHLTFVKGLLRKKSHKRAGGAKSRQPLSHPIARWQYHMASDMNLRKKRTGMRFLPL